MLFDGDEETYKILGTDEGNFENQIISCEAPIAKAIMGKKVGDEIVFNEMKIVILAITRI